LEENDIRIKKSSPLVVKKFIDKEVSKSGDSLKFSIIIQNSGDQPIENLVAIEKFPSEFLQVTSAAGLKEIAENGDLIFKREILESGEIWPIRISAKVKSNFSGLEKLSNEIVVSGKFAAREIEKKVAVSFLTVGKSKLAQPEIISEKIEIAEEQSSSISRVMPKLAATGFPFASMFIFFFGLVFAHFSYRKQKLIS